LEEVVEGSGKVRRWPLNFGGRAMLGVLGVVLRVLDWVSVDGMGWGLKGVEGGFYKEGIARRQILDRVGWNDVIAWVGSLYPVLTHQQRAG
jgi:hypothetical protein